MGDGQGHGTREPAPEHERYGVWAPEVQREYTGIRRAQEWVGFFLPHLHPGTRVLDVGCGVGSITLDLAEIVAPGQVVGPWPDTGHEPGVAAVTRRAEAQRRRRRLDGRQGRHPLPAHGPAAGGPEAEALGPEARPQAGPWFAVRW